MALLTKPEIISLLQKFLPSGTAWPSSPGSMLSSLLASFAHGVATMDLRLNDVLDELNPSTSTSLLAEWEEFVSSVDECCSLKETPLGERQRRVIEKLTGIGSLSRAYFFQMAMTLGYRDITIAEFRPTHCEMTCEVAVMNESFRFLWKVNIPHQGDNHSVFRASTRCDSRIDSYKFGALECQLMRIKPAHTHVVFTYTEVADEAN